MTVEITPLAETEIRAALPDLARLRIAVFRDWPYLYEGDAAYEERYLRAYAESAGAIVVGVRDDGRMVGAATGAPMTDHDAAFADPLRARGYDVSTVFYCGESVLLPGWRGQGIGHRFFDLREEHARALGLRWSAFAAVLRPADHPARPPDYRPLDPFWRARGYAPLDGAIADYAWRDVGETAETAKPMQIWIRAL